MQGFTEVTLSRKEIEAIQKLAGEIKSFDNLDKSSKFEEVEYTDSFLFIKYKNKTYKPTVSEYLSPFIQYYISSIDPKYRYSEKSKRGIAVIGLSELFKCSEKAYIDDDYCYVLNFLKTNYYV